MNKKIDLSNMVYFLERIVECIINNKPILKLKTHCKMCLILQIQMHNHSPKNKMRTDLLI